MWHLPLFGKSYSTWLQNKKHDDLENLRQAGGFGIVPSQAGPLVDTYRVVMMVQKSGDHQLRLVVYSIIYKVILTSQVVVWEFFHQQ